MVEKLERREDHRIWIDLVTQITAKSADGESFIEKTVLRNLSGGGASFITRQVEWYFKGQKLEIEIDLPGTVELKASLHGFATVLRIEPLPETDPRQAHRQYAVAVVIAVPLQFIRKDAGLHTAKPAGE